MEDLGVRTGVRHLEQDAIRGVRLALHDSNAVVFAKVKIAAVLIVGEFDTHRTTARHHFDAALVLQIAVDRIRRDLGGQTLGDRRQKIAMVHLACAAVEASDTHYANQILAHLKAQSTRELLGANQMFKGLNVRRCNGIVALCKFAKRLNFLERAQHVGFALEPNNAHALAVYGLHEHLVGQHAQGAADGIARAVKLRGQLGFGWQHLLKRIGPVHDARADFSVDSFVYRFWHYFTSTFSFWLGTIAFLKVVQTDYR